MSGVTAMFAAVVLIATGCEVTGPAATPPAQSSAPATPGALLAPPLQSDAYPQLAAVAGAVTTIRYRSTAGLSGTGTEVTGVVVTPRGEPPAGGWPVASIAHPTTGVTSDCAPSSFPGLLGSAGPVAAFVSNGYVTVLSDYEGLGTPGAHPYLEPRAAAHNVIDAVRAARRVVPTTSRDWVTYGVSQGGQAAWMANELSDDYGRGLRLVGSMSITPPTDLRYLVDGMVAGTLTTDQKVALPQVLAGVKVVHPQLETADYLHGSMAAAASVFLTCSGDQLPQKQQIAAAAPDSDFRPVDSAAAQRLRSWLGDAAIPTRRAPAPMFVGYGTVDSVVAPAWTVASLRRACRFGDVIEVVAATGQGHGTLDLGARPADWFADRMAGRRAPNSCPLP